MNEKIEKPTPNLKFVLENTKSIGLPELLLGCNTVTGAPMTGDQIEDLESARVFTVTGRKWQSGQGRKAYLSITITEM